MIPGSIWWIYDQLSVIENTPSSMLPHLLNNTLRQRQNGCHFADNIFKCLFFNENVWISIKISLKFVSKGPMNNIPALVHIMAWRRSGNKPLSEPMMVSLPTYICVTWPQCVNTFRPEQSGWNVADDTTGSIVLKKCILILISHLRFQLISEQWLK